MYATILNKETRVGKLSIQLSKSRTDEWDAGTWITGQLLSCLEIILQKYQMISLHLLLFGLTIWNEILISEIDKFSYQLNTQPSGAMKYLPGKALHKINPEQQITKIKYRIFLVKVVDILVWSQPNRNLTTVQKKF